MKPWSRVIGLWFLVCCLAFTQAASGEEAVRGGGPPPQKLVVNLVLQGAGTVEIGPLELVQFAPGEDPLANFKF